MKCRNIEPGKASELNYKRDWEVLVNVLGNQTLRFPLPGKEVRRTTGGIV